jgi:hypothetical protein
MKRWAFAGPSLAKFCQPIGHPAWLLQTNGGARWGNCTLSVTISDRARLTWGAVMHTVPCVRLGIDALADCWGQCRRGRSSGLTQKRPVALRLLPTEPPTRAGRRWLGQSHGVPSSSAELTWRNRCAHTTRPASRLSAARNAKRVDCDGCREHLFRVPLPNGSLDPWLRRRASNPTKSMTSSGVSIFPSDGNGPIDDGQTGKCSRSPSAGVGQRRRRVPRPCCA